MYIQKPFKVEDETEVTAFIQANAFGQLISSVDNRLLSSHVPFLLSKDKTQLLGHLGKRNPQAQDIEGRSVLITLQGAHDYISPSWYKSAGVPTWNYQAVHIYGECRTFNEPEAMKEIVDQLAAKYESAFETPWQPDYKAAMLLGIIGFEVTITDIQAQYKLSQNKSTEDRESVINNLEQLGSHDLAKAMRQAGVVTE